MDGGARSSDNADLALGYAPRLIVSPMGTSRALKLLERALNNKWRY